MRWQVASYNVLLPQNIMYTVLAVSVQQACSPRPSRDARTTLARAGALTSADAEHVCVHSRNDARSRHVYLPRSFV